MEENTILQPQNQDNITTTQQGPVVPESPITQEDSASQSLVDTSSQSLVDSESPIDLDNLDRQGLLDTLRQLLEQEIPAIKGRASALRTRFNELNRQIQQDAFQAFLADGGDKEQYQPQNDSIAEQFYQLYDQYRARRQQYLANLEEQKKKNLLAKQELIDQLRSLVDSPDEQVRSALDRFNQIQERWKAIGDVPREHMNDLWQNYHFQIEQFFSKLKINRELRDLDQKHNLEQKITLCEQAESLILEPSIVKAFKQLQDLRAQWKDIGPVPPEQNEEIWQRFCNAANQIDNRRREYYEQRKEELDSNLLAKQALLQKAQTLVATTPESVRQWNDLTAELDQLLKVWKTIGPVPREANDDIWNQFKGIIDRHYNDKKEHFASLRDQQDANYNKKVELCLKAEAIASRQDWKQATDELLALQQEWKQIGPTSRKLSDKIWQRFRSACDSFFEQKAQFFKERRSSEAQNLAAKEAILQQLKQHSFGDDRDQNLQAIKDFQRQWAEVGFVPLNHKERLQNEFRTEINRIFEQLKISAREAEETAYRERLRHVAPDNRRFVSDERQELQDKIDKLRSDLSLWENNLGFLANSKQADLLKQEFEKKMQSARQQIALLQAKLRILNETEKQAAEEQKAE